MNNNSMVFNESFIRQMVYTFDLIDLRTILRCIPNQVIHGGESSLRNRLLYLLTSSSLQKSIAVQKILEAYKSHQSRNEPRELPLVNQFLRPSKENPVEPIFETSDETMQFTLDHPFLKTLKTLLYPMYCPGITYPTKFEGHYHVSENIESYIAQNFQIEIVLRIEQFGLESFNGRFPRNLNVSINGHHCFLGNMITKIRISEDKVIPYQLSVPIKLTEHSILKSSIKNVLKVSWSNEPHSYVAGVYVVQQLKWDRLLAELQKKPLRTSKKTKELIKESMKSETDVNVEFMLTTINDPISRLRMTLPARGVDCTHLQCFDAIHFLQLNEKKQTWSCPLCKKQIKYENMEVDEFFLNIVENPSLSKECENIILFKNATWAEKKNNQFSNNSSTNNQRLTNNNEIFTLSDSDDSS